MVEEFGFGFGFGFGLGVALAAPKDGFRPRPEGPVDERKPLVL